MTKLLMGFITAGVAAGYFGIRNLPNAQSIDEALGTAVIAGLCVLLFFVGITVGLEGGIIGHIKRGGLKLILFPIAGILGTLTGTALLAFPLGLTINEGMAVGAGFGWYTLAPNLLTAYSPELSAISFIHCLLRLFVAIAIIPHVAKKIGYLESTVLPGVPAADLCLPIIERSTNSSIAIYALITGLIMSLVVPSLIPLLVSL